MSAPQVDAILMASGFSRRFGGQNKLLAPFLGQPLALHTLRLACGLPGLGRVFLVAASPEVAALAAGTRAEVLDNRRPARGARESVRLGVEASRAEHYLFFPCDQPLLDAATVEAVLAKAAPGRISAPSWQGAPGNPVLFSAAFRQELLNLAEGEHARDLKTRHPQCVTDVPLQSPLPLRDADSPDTLAELEAAARQ